MGHYNHLLVNYSIEVTFKASSPFVQIHMATVETLEIDDGSGGRVSSQCILLVPNSATVVSAINYISVEVYLTIYLKA